MNCYHLVVAILAFSTSIDLSEAASCYTRAFGASTDGTKAACDSPKKCYAYIHTSGNNLGKCDTAGCDDPVNKLWCKECTAADCNTRASIAPKCYVRNAGDTAPGASTACTDTPSSVKCISYYDAAGNNLGKCLDGGCGHSDISTGSLHCKDCTTNNCNVKSLIRKCYVRTTSTTSGDGTSTNCATAMADPKCVSYYDASGNNLGKCLDGGCSNSGISTGSLHCKECTADNCNVKSLIQKCYERNAGTTCGDGTSTNCATTMANPKCVSYFNAAGNNIGECKDGGCGSQANCQECTGDNCNVRSLVTTTTAGPTTTADAGAAETTLLAAATRASVGWLTGIMAASACVLALMKPF